MLLEFPTNAINTDTIPIYKQLAKSNRALAELKGFSATIPNKHMLINAMTLNEAKDSSEIEQIVTTHDDLYQAMSKDKVLDAATKEVLSYRHAVWEGYQFILKRGFISTNLLAHIQRVIENNKSGIRKVLGTEIRNMTTGEVIYTPPQTEEEIRRLLANLETYINTEDDTDPLIKLALIHYQFEAIHPFYDGNGRTGRILNILYLVLMDLLDSPVLYLSKYILRTKKEYYALLQGIQQDISGFEGWIVYILKGVEETAKNTLKIIRSITDAMDGYGIELREKLPKIYSKELVEALFFEFYTKTIYMERDLRISRRTAVTYLKKLEENGFLTSEMIGRERVYKNEILFNLIKLHNE
ncbi:filamentation induced by camp protein fic [Listeria weihenstephanensis FSL R9-0317]|uniref:Addiction module protein n=1 Tax=Listeria weihenstephanensis TaxID=1006155 RepID=A0A1S7FTT7_9LIST|nr:Fic/DOC family N-terminal domain-containing protein [Listeria weihenstephanensis]AQY50789.1 addiction module protein [Listeria weihenstephanensis]EUJ38409.1 filamentation induced by camp protein fic [Listeria weihenstephanensis FSL R9-0317]MBC1499458.1 Fic family protein [Listeria weihenstephanensis]